MTDASFSKPPEYEPTDFTVDDLGEDAILGTLYPVTILETRYNGAYSHGKWAAYGKCYRPRDTGGFAGDVEAAKFWTNGPRHYIQKGDDQKKIYAVAANTLQEARTKLIETARDDMDDANVVALTENNLDRVGYLMDNTKFTVDQELTAKYREGDA